MPLTRVGKVLFNNPSHHSHPKKDENPFGKGKCPKCGWALPSSPETRWCVHCGHQLK